MSTKEIAIKSIQELPEDATREQIQERINFVAGVRKGFCELDEGKYISHERVKEEIKKWLSSRSVFQVQNMILRSDRVD